jgi:hypothetical protein
MRIVMGYKEERGVRDGGTRKTLRSKKSAPNEEDVDKVHIKFPQCLRSLYYSFPERTHAL